MMMKHKFSENLDQITSAINKVMAEVKTIDKNSVVGSGNIQYKGVNDADLKEKLSQSMVKHGLVIVPIEIETDVKIERWEETYNNVPKNKQQVFTEVKTKYLMSHISGQWIILSGSGHGIDSLDKSIGKATTYALKYTLLYAFQIATGKIDDADKHHSEEENKPPLKDAEEKARQVERDKAEKYSQDLLKLENKMKGCKTLEELTAVYTSLPPRWKKASLKLKDELKAKLTPKK